MITKNLLRLRFFISSSFSSSLSSSSLTRASYSVHLLNPTGSPISASSGFPYKTSSFVSTSRCYSSSSSYTKPSSSNDLDFVVNDDPSQEMYNEHESGLEEDQSEEEWWEDEGDSQPKIGDGGSGGGVVLNNVPWGERALSIAMEALLQFRGEVKLFSFKTTARGHVFVRLDKPSDKYGCPSLKELESYNNELKERLDEARERGEIQEDLGVKVSTPGADRLLKVPEDLDRFKDMAMRVSYVEGQESNRVEKTQVFMLESLETEVCVWKLANVKENRNPLGKGRPLSRKLKDWRLKLPFEMHKMVSLYIP